MKVFDELTNGAFLLAMAMLTYSFPHTNHLHRTPDTKSATDNCCCSSGWLHNQHGGGNDCVLCLCAYVKMDSFNGGLWQHAVVPGWVMTSRAASPHLFIVSQSLSLGHMSLKNKQYSGSTFHNSCFSFQLSKPYVPYCQTLKWYKCGDSSACLCVSVGQSNLQPN